MLNSWKLLKALLCPSYIVSEKKVHPANIVKLKLSNYIAIMTMCHILILTKPFIYLFLYQITCFGDTSKCSGVGKQYHLDRRSNLTVKQELLHQIMSHRKPERPDQTHTWTNIYAFTNRVSSCTLNDPVDDMWCDVLWADMAKLVKSSTTVWQHSKCCFCSFAHGFHLAL